MKQGWYAGVAAFAAAIINGVVLIAAPMAAQAQDAAAEQVPAAQASFTRWFVELKSSPAADGGNLNTLRNEKAAFRRDAAQAGVQFKERFAFDTLWNGLSIEVAPHQVSKLWRIEGVKNLYPVETMRVPEVTPGESADLANALAMTGADFAQSEMGLTGAGIRVAVMDTGIDYHHPDLGGCFGPACRVVTGWDFVGNNFNADSTSPFYNPNVAPDNDPDDCNGHGTHVAGIIGANGDPNSGGVRGVAPAVTFGAYRVFGCAGSTTADIMIAAMERALADGMNVLNMSIGAAFQWAQYPTGQAANRLVNKGVAVVASIGNSGASGLYSASAPGLGAKVIGVASFDNTHVTFPTFTITPDGKAILYGLATAAPPPPASGTFPMARTGTATSPADACSPLPQGSLSGKAVLIRRGTCAFYVKASNAQSAGAAAVILYNSAAGRFSATVAGMPAITIPVVSISDTEGVLINGRLAAGPVDMTWTAHTATLPNATGNLISAFSSYGLAPDLDLKPDIGAPGGFIRSTYPMELGRYATLSGTSMASPHTAGAVALLLEAKPNTPSNAVRRILQNSADPKAWWGNPGLGFLDNVQRQGAGMLDVPGAILATGSVEPAKLSLGESQGGPATRTLAIENNGSVAVTYNLSHSAALSNGPNTFAPTFTTGFASVAFSVPIVTVPAGGSASVNVTITADAGLADRSVYGGYIVLTPQAGGDALRVPYAGFKGDYQSIQVLAPTANGFPWLAKLVGPSFFKAAANTSYTMVGTDIPFVLAHFDHQSQRVRMEVVDAVSGKSWHRALDLQHFGRNSTAAGFFSIDWDGTTVAGNRQYTVPDGSYVLRLSVLKALGDEANPAHWEIWNSPAFTIARP